MRPSSSVTPVWEQLVVAFQNTIEGLFGSGPDTRPTLVPRQHYVYPSNTATIDYEYFTIASRPHLIPLRPAVVELGTGVSLSQMRYNQPEMRIEQYPLSIGHAIAAYEARANNAFRLLTATQTFDPANPDDETRRDYWGHTTKSLLENWLWVETDETWNIREFVESTLGEIFVDIELWLPFTKSKWTLFSGEGTGLLKDLIQDPTRKFTLYVGDNAANLEIASFAFYMLPYIPIPIPGFIYDVLLSESVDWEFWDEEKSDATWGELLFDLALVLGLLALVALVLIYAPGLISPIVTICATALQKLVAQKLKKNVGEMVSELMDEVGVESGTDTLNQKVNAMVSFVFSILNYLMDPAHNDRPDPGDYDILKDEEP